MSERNKDNNEGLSEKFQMSTIGKVFLAGVAGWLIGNKVQMKIKGTQNEMKQFAAALIASKKFQNELSKSDASAETVMQKLEAKNIATQEFKDSTGLEWPM